MRYSFIGKNFDVTENFSNKITAKLNRIAKLFPAESEANIVDEAVDILERQMVKYKNKLHDRAKKSPAFADELNALALDADEYTDEDAVNIVKSKKFFVKPMDAEEACMEMDMMGHNFFIFRNAETDEIAIVYKRKDGAYGLIEPEI